MTDDYGTLLELGDIVEDDVAGEKDSWKFHYVEDLGCGPEIRDFAAHNVQMILQGKAKRVGKWNESHVIERLINAQVHSSAKDIEIDVWELMDPEGKGLRRYE